MQVSVSASATTITTGEAVSLSAAISNAPAGSPSYKWEIDYGGGETYTLSTNATAAYSTSTPETISFRVTVSYGSGESATSDPVTVSFVAPTATPTPEPTATPTPTPEPTPEIPAAPTNLKVANADGQFEVEASWEATQGATSYQLSWQSLESTGLTGGSQNVTGTSATVTVSGSGQWQFQATACNGQGCGDPAVKTLEVANTASKSEQAAPAAPAALTATPSVGRVSLAWTDPSDQTITKYQYRQSTDGGNAWNPDWTDIAGSGTATTSHTVTGLTNGTGYTFELRAVAGTTDGASASAATTTP